MNAKELLTTRAGVVPALSALFLASGCTTAQQTQVNATVQAVFNGIQYVLPLVDALALGISVAVPGAAGVLTTVTSYLNQAAPIFQSLQATMAVAEAQPLVGEIETYIAGAVKAVATAVQGNPALAAYQTRVAQAEAVVALLTAFVNGVTTPPATAARYRAVQLPLLHS
jgi:hypothetical protein